MVNPSSNPEKKTEKTEEKEEKSTVEKFDDEFEFYDQNKILKYFKSLDRTSISEQKSDFYAYERYINVTELIFNGDVTINPETSNIDPLLAKEKINEEEERANDLKAKKASILQQLSQLDNQLSKSKNKQTNDFNLSMDASRVISKNNEEDHHLSERNNKKLILSKDEHKHQMMKIIKEREEREKMRLIIKQKEEEKLKKLEEEQKKNELIKMEEEKKKKAEEIEEKLKKNKEKHEKFIEEEKESVKKVQEIKNKKFLYEEIEEKFEMKVKMPLLEEQKKLLKEKREFAKAYSIDEIKNHQKAYLELRESSIKKSQAKEIENFSRENYKAPLKSSHLEKILEEEKLEQRQKLIEKKRAIEEKLQRQENYVDYLKENFSKVKIDKNKEEEIKSRIEKNKVKREEFDSRSIGINYLEQAKKLRKKINFTEREETSHEEHKGNITVLSEQLKKQKPTLESRISDDKRGHNLIKKRQEKIQILINDSSINEGERIRKLKMETERINEAFKMKEEMLKYGYSEKVEDEALELLLTSIQVKMGIIDIGKEMLTLKH